MVERRELTKREQKEIVAAPFKKASGIHKCLRCEKETEAFVSLDFLTSTFFYCKPCREYSYLCWLDEEAQKKRAEMRAV